jgi:hypothetical protein
MWRTLSDALDDVPADAGATAGATAREAFLTRLTLLLALRAGDATGFGGLVVEARDSAPPQR